MMSDDWAFGIRTKSGLVYQVGCIDEIYQEFGEWWVDFSECQYELNVNYNKPYFSPPTSRKIVTMNVSAIESIYELADT
jgi:hypothetical protein